VIELTPERIEAYLRQVFGPTARLAGVGEIGSLSGAGMKGFGYGKPLLVRFEQDGAPREAVLSVMRGDKYGHQFYWDRAAVLMFQHEASGRMERHVRPLGLGYVDGRGSLVPVESPREFFLLTEKAEGHDYHLDLARIRASGLRDGDLDLARAFARWLAGVHAARLDDPALYLRRVRETIGGSECIYGLIDGYPYPYEHFPPDRFQALEHRLVDWRWKLHGFTSRLATVHGDFHPWNVLVREGGEFSVLDRSRGEWGEPADDVATMSLNYVLFGLYGDGPGCRPCLAPEFERLYLAFWDEYLDRTGDADMLKVIAPFYVFRGLVIDSPEWYPNHPLSVRQGLFRFMENVLADETFDYRRIGRYMA
jgi:hypothetical protein